MPDKELVFGPGEFIPYGLKGVKIREVNNNDFADVEQLPVEEPTASQAFEDAIETYEQDYTDYSEVDDELGVPNFLNVVERIYRTAPDGTQVVDVVVEVEDIQDAIKYEVRLTS